MSTCDGNREHRAVSAGGAAVGAARPAKKRRSVRRTLPPAAAHRGPPRGRRTPRLPSRFGASDDWEALLRAYRRLAEAFVAQPADPPVEELDAFSALASRSHLSAHELVALHYAVLNGLLASDEAHAAERGRAARLALVSAVLRLMEEYRQGSGDVAPSSPGR